MTQQIVVERVLRAMPGGSESQLALCSNKIHYVIKCAKNLQGPNVLANEFIASELMRALDLPTPRWRFVKYTSRVSCNFLHSEDDLHFGSEMLPPSMDGRLYSFLPSSFVKRVRNRSDFIGALVFDIWAGSTDVRQAVFVEDFANRTFKAVFIDNGFLFGGPDWNFQTKPGIGHCLDRNVYAGLFDPVAIEGWTVRIETMIPHVLPDLLRRAPKEWYKGDIGLLQETLLSRAESIRELFGEDTTKTKHSLQSSFRGYYGPSVGAQLLPGGND